MELVLALFLLLLCLGYFYVRNKYNYWAERGVPTMKPQFPFGNIRGVSFSISLGERIKECYLALRNKSAIGGMYYFVSPIAVVFDLELLRNVMVRDFNCFRDRGISWNRKDPLSGHIMALEGEKWKSVRSRLSPTFTSSKLKQMHSMLQIISDQFTDHVRPLAEQKLEVEMRELLSKFASDVMGNAVLGLECNSLKDPDSIFNVQSNQANSSSSWQFFKQLIIIAFPCLVDILNLRIIDKDVSEFFLNLVRNSMDYREENKVHRIDLLQMMMPSNDKLDATIDSLTLEEVAAESLLFFRAGLATSSTTLTFAAYELALNPEMQERARAEVRRVLDRHDGVLSFEAIHDFTYLDMFIKETMRKYPIGPFVRRKVQEPYRVLNTDIVLEKDSVITIPIMGIHHDPQYYPEPEKFDPERFTKENCASRHPFAYLPFGEGPRGCIGNRFGLIHTRMGLATLLNSFRLLPTEKTPKKMEFDPSTFLLTPMGGVFLRIELVN